MAAIEFGINVVVNQIKRIAGSTYHVFDRNGRIRIECRSCGKRVSIDNGEIIRLANKPVGELVIYTQMAIASHEGGYHNKYETPNNNSASKYKFGFTDMKYVDNQTNSTVEPVKVKPTFKRIFSLG